LTKCDANINFWKHNGFWFFDSPQFIIDIARENEPGTCALGQGESMVEEVGCGIRRQML
jgi:hypothetical protein